MIKQQEAVKKIWVRLMAGVPTPKATGGLLLQLQQLGVAGVQLLVPFSDPMAAQALVQQAGNQALAAGTTLKGVLQQLEELRPQLGGLELTLVVYANPLLTYGYEAFFQACRRAGVGSVLVVDLPYEERGELAPQAEAAGVILLTTLAPSRPERVARLAAAGKGYLYLTGGGRQQEVNRRRVERLVAQAQPVARVPLVLGYPGRDLEEAAAYAQLGAGVLLENLALELQEEQGLGQLEQQLEQLQKLLA